RHGGRVAARRVACVRSLGSPSRCPRPTPFAAAAPARGFRALSLRAALPISFALRRALENQIQGVGPADPLVIVIVIATLGAIARSEEHTSELQTFRPRMPSPA